MEKIVKASALRKEINDLYDKIVKLTSEYLIFIDQYSKTPSRDLKNKITQLRAQLDLLKDDFRDMEGKLAKLEGRQPREININFIPPSPPTGLQIRSIP